MVARTNAAQMGFGLLDRLNEGRETGPIEGPRFGSALATSRHEQRALEAGATGLTRATADHLEPRMRLLSS